MKVTRQDRTRSAGKTADETRTSDTSFTADSELSVNGLIPGRVYAFECSLQTNCHATPDMKIKFVGLTSGFVWAWKGDTTGDAVKENEASTTIAGSASTRAGSLQGSVLVGAGETTCTLQWGQNVSSVEDSTVLLGSYMKFTLLD